MGDEVADEALALNEIFQSDLEKLPGATDVLYL
jgi:hypothetical protein